METVLEIRNEGGLVSATTTVGTWSDAASGNARQAGQLVPGWKKSFKVITLMAQQVKVLADKPTA